MQPLIVVPSSQQQQLLLQQQQTRTREQQEAVNDKNQTRQQHSEGTTVTSSKKTSSLRSCRMVEATVAAEGLVELFNSKPQTQTEKLECGSCGSSRSSSHGSCRGMGWHTGSCS